MKDLPILMSAPMVQGLIREVEHPGEGKRQTRRILNPQPGPCDHKPWPGVHEPHWKIDGREMYCATCGNGVALTRDGKGTRAIPLRFSKGDRLWVRETWRAQEAFDTMSPSEIGRESAEELGQPGVPIFYEADGKCDDHSVEAWQQSQPGKTRVSIHMPRWASRLTLTVTDVRVQRLNDCSEADALAEGVVWSPMGYVVPGVEHPCKDFPVLSRGTAREMYAALWDVINDSGAWIANPWVVAVSFSAARQNIDAARPA